MERLEERVAQAEALGPYDQLVTLKPFTFYGRQYTVGEPVPQEIDLTRRKQMVRTRYAKVLPPGAPVPLVRVAAPEPAAQVEVAKVDGHKCEDCGRVFKSKLNLGAHRRSHRS